MVVCIETTSLAINESLKQDISKLKKQYNLGGHTGKVDMIVQWLAPLELKASKEQMVSFNTETLLAVEFFLKLRPFEQQAYFSFLELFSLYEKTFKVAEHWFDAMKAYQRLFCLEDELKEAFYYWSAVLKARRTEKLPAFGLFQEEMKDIQRWFSEKHDEKEKPLVTWRGRFDEEEKKRLDDYKQKLLTAEPEWAMEDKDLELKVKASFVTSLDREKIWNKIIADRKDLFKKIFPWEILKSEYVKEDDSDVLEVRIKLPTGNEFDLRYVVFPEVKENFSKLVYHMDPPLVSEAKVFMDEWDIYCKVEPHSKFKEISQVTFESNTVVRFGWVRDKIRIPETREKLGKELPIRLKGFRAFVER